MCAWSPRDLGQEYLETVLPSIGGIVVVVNGAHRGHKATLQAVDVDNFAATIKLLDVCPSHLSPCMLALMREAGPGCRQDSAGRAIRGYQQAGRLSVLTCKRHINQAQWVHMTPMPSSGRPA